MTNLLFMKPWIFQSCNALRIFSICQLRDYLPSTSFTDISVATSTRITNKQDCIPVGCVLTVGWPYLGGGSADPLRRHTSLRGQTPVRGQIPLRGKIPLRRQTPSKVRPPQGEDHTLRGQTPFRTLIPPIVDRMTDTCENIRSTFPYTSYAVGN